MERPRALPDRYHHRVRRRHQRPELEPLEGRLVLSLVAVSPSDAKINQSASVGQTLPSVAMDSNGDYVVAWGDQTALYEYNVDARVYNAAGQAVTNEIVVGHTIGVPRPSVAMDAGGDFVVTWQVLNSSTYLYGVEAQRYNLAGSPQGSAIAITNGSSRAAMGESPRVAMDSAGDFTIAYQGYDSNILGIFAQRYNSSGVAQGSTFGVNSVTTGNQSGPSIAMDSAGDFVIAWQDGGQAQDPGIYAQRYNASGVAQGGNTAISTITASNSVSSPANPSVAMEPTGQYVIAWQYQQTASGTGDGFQAIEAQRFDTNGSALTGVVGVSTPANEAQGNPGVAIDSEGDFVVAWAETQGAGATGTIIAQRVNASGTLIGANGGGATFLPSTQSGDSQTMPKVASNPYGDTIIVWQSKPGSPSNQDVYGRLYDHVNDAPTINTPSNVTINENAGQQTVNLAGITAGGGETQGLKVTVSSNNTSLINPSVTYTSPNSTGTLTFTPAANSFGTATITVTVMDDGGTKNGGVDATSVQFTVTVNQVAATVNAVSADWGTKGTVALQTAADGVRLLPSNRKTDLPWYGINKLQITLSNPASLAPGDVSVTGIAVANYGPVTISGSGTSYTISFAKSIVTADRVTVTIGNAGIATFTRRLDVLPGDANDDGVVNAQDLVLVRNDFTALGAIYNVFDDINGDGVIDISDTNLVGRFVGKKLPAIPA